MQPKNLLRLSSEFISMMSKMSDDNRIENLVIAPIEKSY